MHAAAPLLTDSFTAKSPPPPLPRSSQGDCFKYILFKLYADAGNTGHPGLLPTVAQDPVLVRRADLPQLTWQRRQHLTHQLGHPRQAPPPGVTTAACRRSRATTPSGAPPTMPTACSSMPTTRNSVEFTAGSPCKVHPASAVWPAASPADVATQLRKTRLSSPPLTSRVSHGSISISRSPLSYRKRPPWRLLVSRMGFG